MISTDGSITEYVCVYGNNGNVCEPDTRNLRVMGVPQDLGWKTANSRRGYWFTTHTVVMNMAMTKERLINSGFYDLATAYQSVHVNY